jgi:hypothetical protein
MSRGKPSELERRALAQAMKYADFAHQYILQLEAENARLKKAVPGAGRRALGASNRQLILEGMTHYAAKGGTGWPLP